MSLNGYVITGDVYAWAAVLLLPINSAINPFLYTLPAVLNKKVTKYSILSALNVRYKTREYYYVLLQYLCFFNRRDGHNLGGR